MRARTRNISFSRSTSVSTVFGVNWAMLETYEMLAWIGQSGIASRTMRQSAPCAICPTIFSGM